VTGFCFCLYSSWRQLPIKSALVKDQLAERA
jgi:hypothetical protein